MSDFDEFSDTSSLDEFTAGSGRDDPPSLDETLFDLSLFSMFLNYMKNIQASNELLFIKQARLLRMFNAPPDIYAQQAIKMIWMFFSECAKMPVKVSHDVKKKLQEISLDPDAQAKLNKDTFSLAFVEVYNAVLPVYYEWIATNEWQEAVPFHHLAPPTFGIVLTSNTLCVLFNKYINSQLSNDSDGSISTAYHIWKFCIVANDFREGKYTHLQDSKKAKKGKKDTDSVCSEKSEKSEASTDGAAAAAAADEKIDPEEYAKRVYKKYHNYIKLPYDETIPCATNLIKALDHAIAEFNKFPIFTNWLKLKQYQGVDYQAKVVCQSLTKDGYVEPPTFAGILTSSMLQFLRVMLAGRESGLNVEFLVDALRFREKYDDKEKSASSSTESRKEMIEDARNIYAKYIEPGTMYCDPRLVEEVRNAVTKSGGKGINCQTFRRCAAFIYHRSEHSWGRQARATIVWTNKSFDNHSDAAKAIEEEFSLSILPEGIDLQIVPTIDDVLASPPLLRDYADFVGSEVNDAFLHFRDSYEEYFKAPVDKRKPILDKVCQTYGECAAIFPKLSPVHRLLVKEAGHRKRLADSVFPFLSYTIIRAISKKYYSDWIVARSETWKTVPWTPVVNITFSDMDSVYGMSSVQRKIEETALKGKTGLSRFFAKRAIKKQNLANVRTGHGGAAQAQADGLVSPTVFASTDASRMLAFASPRQATDVKPETDDCAFPVPTLAETLASSYLRRHFEQNHLKKVLSPGDFALWEAFCRFYAKYSAMEDSQLEEAQEAMRSDINDICITFPIVLKKAKKIEERAKRHKTIYPQFFRIYEVELYRKHHEEYEKLLRSKGYK